MGIDHPALAPPDALPELIARGASSPIWIEACARVCDSPRNCRPAQARIRPHPRVGSGSAVVSRVWQRASGSALCALPSPLPQNDSMTPGRSAAAMCALAGLYRAVRRFAVEGSSRVSSAIKYLTQSTWSHSAICVGGAAPEPLVEADVAVGVSAVPFSKYIDSNVRICRPIGLTSEDRARLIDFIVGHIGDSYDLKNVFDLARVCCRRRRYQPVAAQSRSRSAAVNQPSDLSSLIAQAFDPRYPILPVPNPNTARCECALLYRIRAASTYTPRDFDLSPYFAVIKPTIEHRFDYQRFPWVESG
jgi:hypothetical protein